MQTIVIMNKVQLLVGYDYMPADDECGQGDCAEVTSVHVANGPEGREFDIQMLLSPAQIIALEAACRKDAKIPEFNEPDDCGDYFDRWAA